MEEYARPVGVEKGSSFSVRSRPTVPRTRTLLAVSGEAKLSSSLPRNIATWPRQVRKSVATRHIYKPPHAWHS